MFRYVNSNQTTFYVVLCVNSSPVIPATFRAALSVNRPVNTQTHILWHTHIDLLSSSLNTLSGSSLCTCLTLSLFHWCFHPSLPLFSLNWGPLERSGLIVSIWECRVSVCVCVCVSEVSALSCCFLGHCSPSISSSLLFLTFFIFLSPYKSPSSLSLNLFLISCY